MKKTIFIFLLLASSGLYARAQELKHTKGISLNVGVSSTLGLYYQDHYQHYSSSDPYSLSGIYEPTYEISSTEYPVFSLSGEYIVNKWLGVGVDMTYSTLSVEKLSGVSRMNIGEISVKGIYLMPSVRGYWVNKERFKLYSGLYTGAMVMFAKELENSSPKLNFSIEVLPIGMRFSIAGNGKFYGVVENLVGSRMLGCRVGLGMGF